MNRKVHSIGAISQHKQKQNFVEYIKKDKWLYIMLLPGILYFLIFKYLPMWGVMIAFKDYQAFLGFVKSNWVGFEHFERFFSDYMFWSLFRNTTILAVYNLIFFFPLPIITALLLNEIKVNYYKRAIQTIIYIPHFMSWVIIAGITYVMFTNEGGIVNNLIVSMGGEKIDFLINENWFRPMIIGQTIWKETGWGSIIFLSAICSIDPQLYEASIVDGASRLRQLWHITLPGIKSIIITLLILRLGNFLDTGFEQIFLMMNSMNRSVGEVFDTYVYTVGIRQGQFSYSTAIGLFKSVIALVLVALSNKMAKKIGEEGIY